MTWCSDFDLFPLVDGRFLIHPLRLPKLCGVLVAPFVNNGSRRGFEFAQMDDEEYSEHPGKSIHDHLKSTWRNMIRRCYEPKCFDYANYGAKGVTVCREWKDRFMSFKVWAVVHSDYRIGLEIDRIDGKGNYEPKNCRWANNQQQARNSWKPNLYGYRGLSKNGKKWRAKIRMSVDGEMKPVVIGTYNTKLAAALAYDQQAWLTQGEFCLLNFPERFYSKMIELDFGDYWENAKRYDLPAMKTNVVLLLDIVARAIGGEWKGISQRDMRVAILRRFFEVSGDRDKFRDAKFATSEWAKSVGFDLQAAMQQRYDDKTKIHMDIREYLSDELARFYYAWKRGKVFKPDPKRRYR